VDLTVRYWAKNSDFWNLHFYILEEAKIRLNEVGINPHPHQILKVQNKKN
ncbi:MAG: mechanosensitive ion channel family protein, partial [Bacteroidetes bacterium]|nr:mechanosensitive ion channel family protein [Bacteroidota bacterium]